MLDKLLNWILEAPQFRIALLAALVGLAGVILGGFLTSVVWPLFKSLLEAIYKRLEDRIVKRKFEQRYLDWVVSEHSYLPLLPTTLVPVTDKHVQKLDKLYVSLAVSDASQSNKEISISDALKQNPSVVIIGDPGAGKTTMLRYLALTLAQARQKPFFILSLTTSGRQKRRKIQQARQRVIYELGFNYFPLPVFVYLNKLQEVTTWQIDQSFLDTLRSEWKAIDGLRDFPDKFFDEKIHSGKCVFLLDAFDELGTKAARDALSRHIGRIASTAPKGNRFIVTSRIVGYGGQLAEYGFSVLTVQKLSWHLIKELVFKWYKSLGATALAEQLMAALKVNIRIAELAVNPMLLSLVVLVQYVRRLIPDKRHVLYDECVKILVERRYAPPNVQEGYDSVVPGDEATQILKGVAVKLHNDRQREVPRKEIESELIPFLLRGMPQSVASTRKPSEILKNIEERSQLLIERGLNDKGEPVMGFSHLTFQEYLTSVALKDSIANRGEQLVSKGLIEDYNNDPEWWEEVALLYAAQLDNVNREKFFRRLYVE